MLKKINEEMLWKAANKKKFSFDGWENYQIKYKLVYNGFIQGVIPLAKFLKVKYPLDNCDCFECKNKTIKNIMERLKYE
ncbi:MAG: hypothetical protein LC122_12525 [Chitinophagales bacterium]|nr:hypothetical protein [Chitinophagales bacterium]